MPDPLSHDGAPSGKLSSDYCRSCNGYSADVGKPDEHGWCERCSYRNTLASIADADPVDMALDPTWAQRNAREALLEWRDYEPTTLEPR